LTSGIHYTNNAQRDVMRLAEVVNVVPVIAKSDSLTLEERLIFKQRVRLSSWNLQRTS